MPCINYFLSVGDGFMTVQHFCSKTFFIFNFFFKKKKYYTHYDFGNSKLGFALAADLWLNDNWCFFFSI